MIQVLLASTKGEAATASTNLEVELCTIVDLVDQMSRLTAI
jgi:hypothetical protein